MVQKKTGMNSKNPKYDTGGEYLSDYMKKFQEVQGIVQRLKPSGSPYQNCVVERINRHFIEILSYRMNHKDVKTHSGLKRSELRYM